jgi:riboflavin kinase/FMN adenylyltransferase
MAVFSWNWETPVPSACRRACLAIGNFDGVHRGHVALARELMNLAKTKQTHSVVMTFDPPPLALLRPESLQPPLTLLEDRCRLLLETGVDHVLVLQTKTSLLKLSPTDFFAHILREKLDVQGMVEGPTFNFGKDRAGSIVTLQTFCAAAHLPLIVVPPVVEEEVIISSSRIRQALLRGQIADANRWLGRCHFIEGIVGEGQKRGRLLGFPTANLEQVNCLLPGDGVYAVTVQDGEQHFPGVANVGPNPTFGEQQRKLEVHLLDYTGNLYGHRLRVTFRARLRDTQKFGSVDELRQQLGKDVAQARIILSDNKGK